MTTKKTVTAVEGKATEVTLSLEPVSSPVLMPSLPAPLVTHEPPSPMATRPESHARRILGGTLMAVGGAGVVAGAVAGALALAQHASLAPTCRGGWMCSTTDCAEVNAYYTKSAVSTLGLVYGPAVAVSGILVLSVKPGRRVARVVAPAASFGPGSFVVKGGF